MAKEKNKQKERNKNLENETLKEIFDEDIAKEENDIQDSSDEVLEPIDEKTALQNELEEARHKAEENMEGWQRAQAEFANYRKRTDRDREQLQEDQTARIILRFIDILDDLDLALKNRPTEKQGEEWAVGVELIYRKLTTILEHEGVTPMKVLGESFDPNLHEAISQDESPDHESGEIIEVLKEGYLIGERVLRPSLVRIAS